MANKEILRSIKLKIKQGWFIIVITIIGLIILSMILYMIFQKTKHTIISNPPVKVSNVPAVRLDLFATTLKSPTDIVSTDDKSDTNLYVLEQAGFVRAIDKNGTIDPTPFLDISQSVQNSGEMGLLGIAFHPNFTKNPYFYVNYVNNSQETIIARFKVSAGKADPTSEKILLDIPQPYVNHNGGSLRFGPDGYLYIGLGDGGSGGDPGNRAQDKSVLLGKILRIDVDKGDPYNIPPTNPFVSQTGVRPEIWAYGLRNPWRINFDKMTGDLYIADVGQGTIEEVDVQLAKNNGGQNYGWRCYEGTAPYNLDGCSDSSNYTFPILEYDHSEGRCSITGGYVYRGKKYSALAGKYFYGDFCGGQLYYATKSNGKWQQNLAVKTSFAISAFGEDNNNELYVADYNAGNIYKIANNNN